MVLRCQSHSRLNRVRSPRAFNEDKRKNMLTIIQFRVVVSPYQFVVYIGGELLELLLRKTRELLSSA